MLSAGEHTITASVMDSRGLTGSASIVVYISPPEVTILEPEDGATFTVADTISLTATATDAEGGDISDAVFWTSNIDGDLDTGASISATLSEGSHTITASATDSRGVTGSASVDIEVLPEELSVLSGIVAAAAGWEHTVALKGDGTVWAWGRNIEGQLGDGSTTSRNTPVRVANLSNVSHVAAGGYHTVALTSSGTVWAWGYNEWGQMGNGSNTSSNVPVQVANLSNVIRIAAGGGHTVALKAGGTVWAWGFNSAGQLGNGSFTDSNVPVQVPGLSGVVAVAAGGGHTVAMTADPEGTDTVWTWGGNQFGQLGDGSTTSRNAPVQVASREYGYAVAAGGHHTLAAFEGSVLAWGYNFFGQLGNGSNTDRHAPAPGGAGGSGNLVLEGITL